MNEGAVKYSVRTKGCRGKINCYRGKMKFDSVEIKFGTVKIT